MTEQLYVPGFTTLTVDQAREIVRMGTTPEYVIINILGNSISFGGGGTVAKPEQLLGQVDSPHERVYTWTKSNELAPGIMPFAEFDGSINIDPIMALAKELAYLLGAGTKIVVNCCSAGGTMLVGATSNWNSGEAVYEAAVTRTNACIAALPNSRVLCTFMSVGDLDGSVEAEAETFYALALQFIDDWRAALDPDVNGTHETHPIVFTTVRNGTHKAIVNEAIRNLPLARAAIAVAEGEDLESQAEEEFGGVDTVHLGPNARRFLGRRWSRAALQAFMTAPQARPFRDQDADALATAIADLNTAEATLAAHVGSGGAAHADAVAGGADGFMTGADKTKLNGIATGAQVNTLETSSNLGSGAQLGGTIATKNLPLRTLLMPQGQLTQNTNEIVLHPLPAYPEADLHLYADGMTGTSADVALDVKVGVTASLGTILGVVGFDGDGRYPALLFAGTNAININTFALSAGAYTIAGWVSPGAFPAGARRHICGSQTASGGQGWEFSFDKINKVDSTAAIVDQWYEVRASHLQDAGVLAKARTPTGRWVFVAQTYNYNSGESAGRLWTFVDGRVESSRTFPVATQRLIQIGSFNASLNFVGAIADLWIWGDVSLSPRQLERLMLETADPLHPWPQL